MQGERPPYQRSPYGAFPTKLIRGEDCVLYDSNGKSYIDLCGGWGAVSCGHGNPTVQAALLESLQSVAATAYLDPPAQASALELLNPVLPPGLGTVALYSTGAEAIDFALRLARSHTGANRFLSFRGHFHGKTHGNMYLLGTLPDCYGPRPPDYGVLLDSPEDGSPESLAALDAALEEAAGQGPFAGLILEPVVGYSGPHPLPAAVLERVRAFCDQHGALMILDEVFTSMFRCGAWFEACSAGISPHILVFGKGMGNGFPVAGVAASRAVSESVRRSLPGSTYAGNGLAWAAVKGVLQFLQSKAGHWPGHVAALEQRARDWAAESPMCQEQGLQVDGKGAMIGLRLGPAWQARIQDLVLACLEEGVVPSHAQQGLRLTPPLTISVEAFNGGLATIERAFARLAD